MLRRKQPNRLKLFYYSHPYFIIFIVLIVYNLILIALAALVMTYLMNGVTDEGYTMGMNLESYLRNLEYCAVFTMNNGGIYNQAPTSVIVLKIILSVLQMITFTGALIGLATSILQSMFRHRIDNVGKVKIKNHFAILEWSAVGPNLIRELSFMRGNKAVVILSQRDREEILEEIDNLFLETGTDKKHLRIFVKHGNPASRKALKEINIDKASSVAILGASSWLNQDKQSDSLSFKILMSVIALAKEANVVIETDDQEVTQNIHDLMASSDLKDAHISIFSRNAIVGHVLAKTAINPNYPDLYYSLLSFRNGTFVGVEKDLPVSEALPLYSNCLPAFRYPSDKGKELLFFNAERESDIRRSLFKRKRLAEAPYKKHITKSSFSLYVIGENDCSTAIKEAVFSHNELGEGKVNLKILPIDADIDSLVEDLSKTKGKKKILILSDDNASAENTDANVFLSLIRLKANGGLKDDVEVFAEIFEPSNRFSLESLNITDIIIANQMVAVYMTQLLCHEESHRLYEDLLSEDSSSSIAFEIRQGKELLNCEGGLEFPTRGDFVNALYQASHEEYLPLGFIGDPSKGNLASAITGAVAGAVTGTINAASKVIGNIGNALTLSDAPEDVFLDFKDVTFLNKNLNKKEKIVIHPDTTMILIHKKK